MPSLKIKITGTLALPRGAVDVARATAEAITYASAAARTLRDCGIETEFGWSIHADETPPPAPPERKRRARSAPPVIASAPPGNGPSAPLAQPSHLDAPGTTSPASAAGEPDPLDIPGFLRRDANGERAA